jgi:excisionase family DNA binding protein
MDTMSSAQTHLLSPSPVVELSFDITPFVSIVGRHVRLGKKTRDAIARDFAEALSRPNVHLLSAGKTARRQSATLPENDPDPVLTTEEAAQLAGVSRPFMAKLIDAGAVELQQMVGKQRRVRKSAVTRWQQSERARQAQSLKRLTTDLDEEIFSS